jgi:hypothetical protein
LHKALQVWIPASTVAVANQDSRAPRRIADAISV